MSYVVSPYPAVYVLDILDNTSHGSLKCNTVAIHKLNCTTHDYL